MKQTSKWKTNHPHFQYEQFLQNPIHCIDSFYRPDCIENKSKQQSFQRVTTGANLTIGCHAVIPTELELKNLCIPKYQGRIMINQDDVGKRVHITGNRLSN